MKTPSGHPPQLARHFLEWWCRSADIEDLLGDIDEYFDYNVAARGLRRARFIYCKQVLSLVFSYAITKRKRAASYSAYYPTSSLPMLQNYFKIALRNFASQKFFTIINITGLALGMSVCVLALSIFVSVFRFDEFHEHKDRVFQINTEISDTNGNTRYSSTFFALGDHLEKYPFVEEVVKIKKGFSPEIRRNGNLLNFRGYYADPTFFDAFSLKLLSGDPATALSEPFTIILTESVAETLFRDQDPVGQILETSAGPFKVTGVMEERREAHLYFEMLTAHQTYERLYPARVATDWVRYRDNYVYVILREGTSPETLEGSLQQIAELAGEFNPAREISLKALALNNIVPSWNISNSLGVGWDLPTMLFFILIGLLVLLPAIFNYTNLSIAQALKRAREIGVRKVVGAEKSQIRAQFIMETILLTFLAMIGAIGIFTVIRSEFLDMVIASKTLDVSMGVSLVIVLVLFALLVGFFTGLFPALYFSRMNPIQALRGQAKGRSSGVSGIRKGLFVFQFFLSLFFIIGVGAIARQYTHVFSHDHGFDSDNVLVVPFQEVDKQLALNELQRHTDVKSVTTASNPPGLPLPVSTEVTPNGQDTLMVGEVFIGENFIEDLDMKLIWGQSGHALQQTQNEAPVLVNEQYLRSIAVFNEQQDSLTFTLEDGTRCRIVGILEDFNFEPLNEEIRPFIFRYSLANSHYALVTINTTDIRTTIEELDAIWTGIDQKARFNATFLDDEIEEAYSFLMNQIRIFGFLSVLVITISCLGLLGMVSYTTENRTKEIAIRKIMGATNRNLYYTLTKDFVRLILIAAAFAIPVAYFFYDWLFLRMLLHYGKGLGWMEMVGGVALLFVLGFLSIFGQTSKLARANPADNLRYE